MSLICTIHVDDEVNCRIGGLRQEHSNLLYEKLSVFVDGYQYMPLFQLKRWDGKVHFFEKSGKTYTKLLDEILPYLASWGYEINLNDQIIPAPVITDLVDKDFFGTEFVLR